MKAPSSSLGVGFWVVGGLVGLYLLVFCLVVADTLMSGGYFFGQLPVPVLNAMGLIYSPLENLLGWLGIL